MKSLTVTLSKLKEQVNICDTEIEIMQNSMAAASSKFIEHEAGSIELMVEEKTLKKENANLKDSNENHIFINEKLNKALKKSEDRIEKLTQKIKTITNESVIIPKSQYNAM